MKTRRHNAIDAYRVITENHNYLVTLERLKNDINGNPRYKAVIVNLTPRDNYYYNAVYTFGGYFRGGEGAAREIVNHYENDR